MESKNTLEVVQSVFDLIHILLIYNNIERSNI